MIYEDEAMLCGLVKESAIPFVQALDEAAGEMNGRDDIGVVIEIGSIHSGDTGALLNVGYKIYHTHDHPGKVTVDGPTAWMLQDEED